MKKLGDKEYVSKSKISAIFIVMMLLVGVAMLHTTSTFFPAQLSLTSEVFAEFIDGTDDDDDLTGTDDSDNIEGRGGDDNIDSGDENDLNIGDTNICDANADCSGGDDKIKSGKGDDRLSGDVLNCISSECSGDDKLNAGQGDDLLTGGPGADKFKCGKGTDKVTDFNKDEGDKAQKSCEIFGPF